MPAPSRRRRWRWTRLQRTTVFLVLGLAIIVNEAFVRDEAQLDLLLVGLALCGFPQMLNASDALKRLLTEEDTSEEVSP